MINTQNQDFRLTAKVIVCVALLGLAGAGLVRANAADTAATTPAPLQSPVTLTPGQWEIQQTMIGAPDGDQPRLRTTCFSEGAFAADPIAALRPEPPAGRPAVPCKTRNFQSNFGQISYETACSLPFGTMKTKWHGTITTESFDVTGQTRIMGRSINTQVSGVRLSECIIP
jgi:Protein of unknown function (DUF3617)